MLREAGSALRFCSIILGLCLDSHPYFIFTLAVAFGHVCSVSWHILCMPLPLLILDVRSWDYNLEIYTKLDPFTFYNRGNDLMKYYLCSRIYRELTIPEKEVFFFSESSTYPYVTQFPVRDLNLSHWLTNLPCLEPFCCCCCWWSEKTLVSLPSKRHITLWFVLSCDFNGLQNQSLTTRLFPLTLQQ